jgi:hypothetical protein
MADQEDCDRGDENEDLRDGSQRAEPENNGCYPH